VEHQYNIKNNCPLCDHIESKHFISANDHNVSYDSFNITECIECGLKFTNPRIKEEKIGDYYKSEDYISHSNTNKGLINKLYHLVRNYQIKQKEKLISKICENKTLLDIGCGTGDFINYCKGKKWSVSGLEPDKKARSYAENNFKLNVYPGLKSIKNNTVDVVTMWHSLEHIYNLKDDLNSISQLINKNGHLIIAVPNSDSYDAKYYKTFWAAYDLPIHLYHFNKKNIYDIAKAFGFTVIKIKPLIFDSFYISMLSERKKNGSVFKGIILGLISNINAIKTTNHSSLIYILRKN